MERNSEDLKVKKKPDGWKSEKDNVTEESQHAYEQIIDRIKKVEEDYHSALLTWNDTNSLEQKRE